MKPFCLPLAPVLVVILLNVVVVFAQPPSQRANPERAMQTAQELLGTKPRPPRPALPPSSLPLKFIQGERIALVGGSLGERMNLFGHFETLLHSQFPNQDLVFRNFCRPADEVALRQRPNNYTRLDDPLAAFGADTFLCFFGFNESFAGPSGVDKFKTDYAKFLDDYARQYPRDDTGAAPRFVLVSPAAFEGANDGLLSDGKKENENLKLYSWAVSDVAQQRGTAFVDVFTPTEPMFARRPGLQFTINGCHLNEDGDRELALLLDRALFGAANPVRVGSPAYEKLRAAVNDKSWVHLQDYRMLNGWYVYGGRRTLDTETFPREFVKIRNMAAARDRYVWDIARGQPVPAQPDDSNTGELFTPPSGFGNRPRSEPTELKYLTPEESIKTMAVPEGFEVQLVASEREFPQLAKPDQINFDNKGRLWALCMPTYPQWKPGEVKPADRLLLFEDANGDGKADQCKVFYDKLTCPTGFEFWNSGVLVVDQPRLLFIKDTNGDDRADVVVQLLDGWASDDTHHAIGAFEWSNGGLLHMLEGVSMSTAVETPWGPFRRREASGCYVLDPRTLKLRHFNTPGYGNPWCYVFNWWGQGIVGDGTTDQQHWDSPLSGEEIPERRGLNTIFSGEGMRPVVGTEFLYTRQFPDEVQGHFIYACVINMNGLTRFEVHDDGSGYGGSRLKKAVDGRPAPHDLLVSTDKNFRPADPQIGPDGALYFADWHTALIGHMQYSQRDPSRDHSLGRLYRLVYKNRPLLKPVTQFGKSVPELLDQLKAYEPRTRYAARRELRDRPAAEVTKAVKNWTSKLSATDPQYDHHLSEALWVLQGHHAVDTDFLKRVLRAKTGEARAAATRVLADEWPRIPNALALLKPQLSDDFPRTRLEAVRALSFVPSQESLDLLKQTLALPRDYWLDYTWRATLTALGASSDETLGPLAGRSGGRRADRPARATMAAAEAALKKLVGGGEVSSPDRQLSYAAIAQARGNAENGKALFSRICSSCHKIGSEGIEFGPDITASAGKLSRAEIVESILDPNAKLATEFLTTNLETKNDEAVTGFVLSEDEQSVTMRVAGGLTRQFAKTDLARRDTLKLSSMPEGFGAAISTGEFFDLVEFVASLKGASQ